MLGEQSVDGEVVTVDDRTVVGRVGVPTDTAAVIGPPQPQVIGYDVGTRSPDSARWSSPAPYGYSLKEFGIHRS
ncbi:hypothetical protein GCM10027444_13800 [Actinopolyspora lacussalsi]